MTNADKITETIKQLNHKSTPALRDRILSDASQAIEHTTNASAHKPSVRRILMTSKFTKFVAAAVIIIAATASVHFVNNAVTPAYSMEQTIKAGQNVRFLHFYFCGSMNTDKIDKEAWLEYDENGQIKNIRVDWYNQPAGDMTMVWKQGRIQYWSKKTKKLRFFEDEIYTEKMVEFARRDDPTRMVKHMYDLEKEGKVTIKIEESSDIGQPITLACTWLPNTYIIKGTSPQMREVVFIDQVTKLVRSVEVYELKDGNYVSCGVWKYTDYAEYFEPKIFDLEAEAPSDVKRLNLTSLDIGLERTDLTDEEIAVKVVSSFLQALIEKDYKKAVKIHGYDDPDEINYLIQKFEKLNLVRIIELGEPVAPKMDSRGKMRVPCRVELQENGQIIEWEIQNMFAQRVIGHPNRWQIEAEFDR